MRLVSLISFSIAAILIIAGVLLLPSRLMLSIEKGSLQSEKRIYDESVTTQNSQGLISTLNDIKSMVTLATPDNTALFTVVRAILLVRPDDVAIRSIAYTRGLGAPSSVTLQGVAGTRANLISFFKILQKDPRFTDSALPVGSLAKESNVPFTINLKGEF